MKAEKFDDTDRDTVVEDEFVSSGTSTPEEDEVKYSFERDVEDAKILEKRYELSSSVERNNARRNFVNSRFGGWKKRTKNEYCNFLHHLAYSKPSGKPSLQWLMARAISKLPELMGEMDFTKRTPLTVALSNSQQNDMFVYAACKNTTAKTKKLIGEALKSECDEKNNERGSTCLHWAVQRAINPELISIMTGFVPLEMFTATDVQGRTPLHVAVEYEACSAEQVDIVRALLVRGQAALNAKLASDYGQCNVYQHHEYTRRAVEGATMNTPSSSPKKAPGSVEIPSPGPNREAERRNSSVKIRDLLKFMYLRTQKPLEAAESLHVKGQPDKELWFDFGPEPLNKINERDFKKRFAHLEFEKVLQYVAFPRVEIERDAKSPDKQPRDRNDMCFFFDWLRQKGVQRIIRVEVYDMDMPCHRDETIVEILKPFGVEVLDWCKQDLSPLAISKISSRLREVFLYWSGEDAALKSWTGPQGLALTPTLKRIELRLDDKLEALPQIQSSLNGFEARLQQSWPTKTQKIPSLDITPWYLGGRNPRRDTTKEGLTEAPAEPQITRHRWIDCMEGFTEYYKSMKGIQNKGKDPLLHPVTVALIDDGVDTSDPSLDGASFAGKSFDSSPWEDDRVSPYWESTCGHGTLMARLIRRMCPSAEIYVIKLKGRRSSRRGAKIDIDTQGAIKAIEHATEVGAQIISMSWTIEPPDDPAIKQAFDQAIYKAHEKGSLMFCAASDQGRFQDVTYPHASNPNYTFRIGAATAACAPADFVTADGSVDFVLPGHEVNFTGWYWNLVEHAYRPKMEVYNGSSVSTALAAGLAALVMECVRLGVFYTMETEQWDRGVAIKRDEMRYIRDKKAMEYAFNSMNVNRHMNGNARYIEVWDTFDSAAMKLKWNEGAHLDQLEAIAGLARIFLRTGARW